MIRKQQLGLPRTQRDPQPQQHCPIAAVGSGILVVNRCTRSGRSFCTFASSTKTASPPRTSNRTWAWLGIWSSSSVIWPFLRTCTLQAPCPCCADALGQAEEQRQLRDE